MLLDIVGPERLKAYGAKLKLSTKPAGYLGLLIVGVLFVSFIGYELLFLKNLVSNPANQRQVKGGTVGTLSWTDFLQYCVVVLGLGA